MLLQHFQRALQLVFRNCKGDIFCPLSSHRLEDDIHIDIVCGKCIKDPESDARLILHTYNRDPGCIFVGCNACN